MWIEFLSLNHLAVERIALGSPRSRVLKKRVWVRIVLRDRPGIDLD